LRDDKRSAEVLHASKIELGSLLGSFGRYRSRTRAIEEFGFMADEIARRFNVSFEAQTRRASAA
jgi:hypothetical protein